MALKPILRFHYLAAIAVEESLVGCAGLDHLLGQGRVQDGGGRVLVGNLLDCLRWLTLRCFEVGALVIWKRGEDPGRESSVEGKGWLREFVMQLSAWKEEVM